MGLLAHTVKSVSRLELALVLMALASIVVLLAPSDQIRTSYEFLPSRYPARLADDNHLGGTSEVRWIDKDTQRWQCVLNDDYHTPFCSMQIDVVDAEGKGLDLREYDRLTIWANYQGDGTHLRLYLRNRHPNYYKPEFDISTKYNVVEFPVDELTSGLELSMGDFNVATWWLIGGKIPLKYSHPEFNDVSILELQTGSSERRGTHNIHLQKLVWSAPLVSRERLYQGVIIAWTLCILGLVIHRLVVLKIELKRNQQYQEELLATNAALNLENRHYEDLAKTDALTGLSNRVGIRDLLHSGIVNWRIHGTPLSLIFMDIDKFKRINDAYGHDAGDEVLKQAAALVQRNVRRTDTLARWGGEEFVLVCPNTTLDRAYQVAEHLRTCFKAELSFHGEAITSSFGVATMTKPSLDHLFKKADVALYKAKRLGRNRVCSEEPEQLESA